MSGDNSTISQRFGSFAAGLSLEAVPPLVIDKVKALLLHGLFIGLASHAESDVAVVERIIATDSSGESGDARLLSSGIRASRSWAAFANSVLFHARGQDDSFRMLTHPGCCIIPAALAAAEGNEQSGQDLLVALAAGYEIHCRLAKDFVPSVQNRGFRSSAVFGVFGPTVATAKVRGLGGPQIAHALALAVGYAFGDLETSRAGTREMTFQEPVAVQSGMTAAALAAEGVTGAPECFEGALGFFHTFVGSVAGELSGSFDGKQYVDLQQVTADLGNVWELLGVTMKIYSGAGFVQPIIEGCALLAQEHDIDPTRVQSIDIEMNEWETFYPSPRAPRQRKSGTDEWDNAHFAVEALIGRGYPSTGRRMSYGGRDDAEESPLVQALTKRVHVTAGPRPQYGPRITVTLENGRDLTHEMTGDEFKWDFATDRERIKGVYAALPFDEGKASEVVETIANLESLNSVDHLVDLVTNRP